jgi:CheY-like chemotaxis protein
MIKNVLIVDDEQEVLDTLRQGLGRYSENFSVIPARSGEEALRELRDRQVSLVVTDMKMPGMDGFSLLAHIMEHYPDVPVIIITGYSTPEIKRQAEAGGAVGFVEKPFSIEKLAGEISSALRRESEGGVLHGISSATFLQLIELEQKTCTIRVEERASGRSGVLFFVGGELFDARTNGGSGLEAAYEILSWESVNLSIQNSCNKQEQKIRSDLRGLLLEAMRRKDETGGDRDESDEQPEREEARSPVDQIRRRLGGPDAERWGVEEVYLDHAWEELLDGIRSAGEQLGAGGLKMAYLDRRSGQDVILIPSGEGPPAVVTVNPGAPKDRILRALLEHEGPSEHGPENL